MRVARIVNTCHKRTETEFADAMDFDEVVVEKKTMEDLDGVIVFM